MFISELNIRLLRRVQVKEYEPFEAEVSGKAHIEEGDDFVAKTDEAIALVKSALGQCFARNERTVKTPAAGEVTEVSAETAPEKAAAEPAQAKRPRGRPRKPVEAPSAKAVSVDLDDDIGFVEPAVDADDEVDDGLGDKTPSDLQQHVIALIGQGRLTPDKFKIGILKDYGVDRSLDLPIEKVPEVWKLADAAAKPPKNDSIDV